jgi:hypothetical protein
MTFQAEGITSAVQNPVSWKRGTSGAGQEE